MPDFSEGPVANLNWIFEAPIEAVIKANVMAATAFYDFLAKCGFAGSKADPDQKEVLGDLRMVRFSFEQPTETGLPVTRVFAVPFLSLIQLPLLEVKDATFEFGVRVLTAIPSDHGVRRISLLRASEEPEPPPVTWKAALASGGIGQTDETRPDLSPHLAANMTARVSVGQADIPAGIRNLLALMGENAQVTSALLEATPKRIEIPQFVAEQPDDGTTPLRPIIKVPIINLQALASVRQPGQPREIIAHYPVGLTLMALSADDARVPWPSGTRRPTDESGRLVATASWTGEALPENNTIEIIFGCRIDGFGARVEVEGKIIPR